jgi:hypothetical protein
MSRQLLLLVALAALPLFSARAEPLSDAQIRALAAGGEFRGYAHSQRRGFENHIWRFSPDGRVTATANAVRSLGGMDHGQDYGDTGTWRVEAGRLCLQWQGANVPFSGCYTVDATPGGNQVRLIGPTTWQGSWSR